MTRTNRKDANRELLKLIRQSCPRQRQFRPAVFADRTKYSRNIAKHQTRCEIERSEV